MASTNPAAPAVREGETPSIVRTVVPVIVGAVVAYLGGIEAVAKVADTFGVDVNDAARGFELFAAGLLTSVYYTVVRFLETRVKPQFGWLLGLAKLPVYTEVRDRLRGA